MCLKYCWVRQRQGVRLWRNSLRVNKNRLYISLNMYGLLNKIEISSESNNDDDDHTNTISYLMGVGILCNSSFHHYLQTREKKIIIRKNLLFSLKIEYRICSLMGDCSNVCVHYVLLYILSVSVTLMLLKYTHLLHHLWIIIHKVV